MKRGMILAALLLCMAFGLSAQDFYDINTVNNIQLFFTQTNWDQLLDQLHVQGEERLMGSAIINGVPYDSVGVRYKGNSSYNANRNKNPFNIKLDYVNDDQLLDGTYGTIKLANGFSDPSFIRETLSYEIARKYMPACKANYANVYVNNQLIGVYTSVQDVDSYFMSSNMHCSGKSRFKSDTNTMSAVTVWGYLGADSTAYQAYYQLESDYSWADLINFTYTLNQNQNNIASVMNVDQHLWMCAFDNLLVNLDSPINLFHNFYLFEDADNRINPLLWDLNMSFGGFGGGNSSYNPLQNSTSATFPLLSKVLSNARYKKMYIAHMRTMITENFSNGWYATRGAELQAICGPSVQADPNFFYTYANFQNNLNNSVSGGSGGPGGGQTVPGITTLMNARSTYLLSHTAFAGTVPTLTAYSHSPQEVAPYSTVTFTTTPTNATFVQLGIRQNIANKFNYYEMFDDGAHGDGAAGDGTYGVSVDVASGDIQYYFWAENASQGMFFPARAEHEFYSISVANNTGEVLINEIMAKNASYPDPNSELDDWVELYNPNDYPVDIGGMYMTDSHYSAGISAWTQIPTNTPTQTTIPPHGYLIVWYDEDLDQGPLHVNDKLGGGGDSVYIIDADGNTVVDYFTWVEATGMNVDDVSIGRTPDGGNTWQLFGAGQVNPSTPGASNGGATNLAPTISDISYSPQNTTAQSIITVSAQVADSDGSVQQTQLLWGINDPSLNTTPMSAVGSVYSAQIGPFPLNTTIRYQIRAVDNNQAATLSSVYTIIIGFSAPALKINEIMPSNTATITDEYSDYDDWVEIINIGNDPVDIAGYYFTDNHYPEIGTSLTQIPAAGDSTIIMPGTYKIIWFDEEPGEGCFHMNTKLGTGADAVYLIAPDMLTVVDQASWDAETALAADLSWGRLPDGGNFWMLFGTSSLWPVTPGVTNGSVANDDPSVPVALELLAYPNPANAMVNIELKGTKQPTGVMIYNVKGQLVRQLEVTPGQKAVWDGKDNSGRAVGSGVYYLRTDSRDQQLVRRICLIK